MPIIPDKDQVTLKERFKRELKSDVTLTLFTQRNAGLIIPGRECRYCDDTLKLMEELSSLSSRLRLEVKDFYAATEEAKSNGVERIPALILSTNGASNVRFFGIPLGFEFATILEDVITLSRGVSPLALETRKKLKRVKEKVHIQVFVTSTCQYCPQVARVAHAMAMDNPRVTADVIEVEEFPPLGRRYLISGVPKTVINETTQFVGAMPESAFVNKVLESVGLAPHGKTNPPGDGSGPQTAISL